MTRTLITYIFHMMVETWWWQARDESGLARGCFFGKAAQGRCVHARRVLGLHLVLLILLNQVEGVG